MQGMQSRVGYTDLLAKPEDGRRCEIHQGELVVVPSPLPRHQLAARAVFLLLNSNARETGGDALFAPLDIVFDEHDVAQPDIVFFRAERRHLIRPDVVIRHPPDIAVEVLSPSTAATDRGAKMRLFARHGVPEYWIVDPVHEQIEQKLVVAVASSALFDLGEADGIYVERGEDAYRVYQREHENDVLDPGVAFAFIRRLLLFNRSPDDSPVEVILLSRNDPDTGLRVFNSIEAHGLDITRAAFLNGSAPFRYIPGFNASIFLSADARNVEEAIMAGYPAGLVLDSVINDDADDLELRVAFDFDGVVADDAAEQVFQAKGIEAFHRSETE